jgi:hypothetical protein
MAHPRRIPFSHVVRKTWFEMVFGIEETLSNIDCKIDIEEHPDDIVMKCCANERLFSFGPLEILSCSCFRPQASSGPGSFSILDGPSFRSAPADYSDFLVLQSLPRYNGSTFQVLSTFNCLAFIGPDQTAEIGITGTIYDKTQGAQACLACAPAFLYRNYFVPHPDESIGQLCQEIELLSECPLKVRHGYLVIDNDDIHILKSSNFDWSNLDYYPIGLQRNSEVALSRKGNAIAVAREGQFVHQAFMGTLNFAGMVVPDKFTRDLAKYMLTAGYRATILAAWENSLAFPKAEGAHRCILTLAADSLNKIPVELVCSAISACEDVIMNCGLEIILVCTENVGIVSQHLEHLMQRTGGKMLSAAAFNFGA